MGPLTRDLAQRARRHLNHSPSLLHFLPNFLYKCRKLRPSDVPFFWLSSKSRWCLGPNQVTKICQLVYFELRNIGSVIEYFHHWSQWTCDHLNFYANFKALHFRSSFSDLVRISRLRRLSKHEIETCVFLASSLYPIEFKLCMLVTHIDIITNIPALNWACLL